MCFLINIYLVRNITLMPPPRGKSVFIDMQTEIVEILIFDGRNWFRQLSSINLMIFCFNSLSYYNFFEYEWKIS